MTRPSDRRGIRWLLLASLVVLACGDNPTNPPNPPPPGPIGAADSIATYWMQALGDSIAKLPPDSSAAWYRTHIRYPEIRAGMQQALQVNSNSRVAHLGSGLLDIVELNYDTELWGMIDSLDTRFEPCWFGGCNPPVQPPYPPRGGLVLRHGSPILGNQFTLLATAPRELMRRASAPFPPNLTLKRAQELVERLVLPVLGSASAHLTAAEADGGPSMQLRLEDEVHEIDQGELLLFHASLLAARAGLLIATAYDVDLPGRDGTYNWIDDIDRLDDGESRCGILESIPDSPYQRFVGMDRWKETEATQESVMVDVLRYNLEQRPGFLTLRGSQMAAAHADLLAMLGRLEAAAAAIRSESDPQGDDVIRIVDLVDLDTQIQDIRDVRFAADFTSIEDVLAWARTVLSGTYHIEEDGAQGLIQLDVNLSALFANAAPDWRAVLPYYRFQDSSGWITRQLVLEYSYPRDPTWQYCDSRCGVGYECMDGVAEVAWSRINVDFKPIELLDGPNGNPIDLVEEVIPYFPDYTLRGLFPGATRPTWLAVANAAGW